MRAHPVQDTTEEVADVVPFLMPVEMWTVLVRLGRLEGCAPGEVLDRALCQYLEGDPKRVEALRGSSGNGQSIS